VLGCKRSCVVQIWVASRLSFANESEPLPVFLSHQLVLPVKLSHRSCSSDRGRPPVQADDPRGNTRRSCYRMAEPADRRPMPSLVVWHQFAQCCWTSTARWSTSETRSDHAGPMILPGDSACCWVPASSIAAMPRWSAANRRRMAVLALCRTGRRGWRRAAGCSRRSAANRRPGSSLTVVPARRSVVGDLDQLGAPGLSI
jgi:hypothetical protein